jgi:nicotinate phosphoribosyltransferase
MLTLHLDAPSAKHSSRKRLPSMPTSPTDTRSPLFTDLYQLTMLQAYFREGMNERAVFDLFVRRLRHRNYLLACGLETVLDFLETLHFTDDELDYLAEQDAFEDDFLDHLADFRFTGDVYAMPEGTPVFADEPILEVVAPIGEAQLVETYLLNQITFQTGLASKAVRVVQAARRDGTDRAVADFGMRRMHGTDAAMKAARACHIAGVRSTSNVLAGQTYNLPITGTMAHSYIEAHDSEMDAFEKFAQLYPETTLLVDTYDTLDGVRKVIDLAEAWGDDFRVQAIRLDSGDLATLAHQSRQLLDDAGLDGVKIFASSSLDEHKIMDLLDRGAPIDGFGVGTKMGTMADQPYLDSAYKLAGYAGKPRMKLSKEKSNLPGRKQVVRQFEDGIADRDIITTHDESVNGESLLQCVMQDGARTDAGQPRSLDAIRAYAADQQDQLPARLRALSEANPPYSVTISDRLAAELEATRERLEAKMEA